MAKTKEIRKFRLREGVGPHFEPNPEFNSDEPETEDNIRDVEILPGKTVKSPRQLDKLFVNKFDPVGTGDRTNVQTAGGDTVENPEQDPDKDRPVRDAEDALVRRGDRFAEEEELEGKPKLQKLAKGKKIKASEDEDEEESSAEEGDEEEEKPTDVTKKFEGAKEGGLQVFKDSSGTYRVHESGEDEPMEGAKRGFTKVAEVKSFIKKNVKIEE